MFRKDDIFEKYHMPASEPNFILVPTHPYTANTPALKAPKENSPRLPYVIPIGENPFFGCPLSCCNNGMLIASGCSVFGEEFGHRIKVAAAFYLKHHYHQSPYHHDFWLKYHHYQNLIPLIWGGSPSALKQ